MDSVPDGEAEHGETVSDQGVSPETRESVKGLQTPCEVYVTTRYQIFVKLYSSSMSC